MSFNDYQAQQVIDKLDRIATALEHLADNHDTPAPSPGRDAGLPRSIPNTNKSDFQF